MSRQESARMEELDREIEELWAHCCEFTRSGTDTGFGRSTRKFSEFETLCSKELPVYYKIHHPFALKQVV